ncbi:CASP-like protein 4A1 [Phaseolus vulgaris]|uniref:CASP-like protein 4A1 n=1 Tax=Phaseolus vulgaris TaxID=3885 RepID=UPI0035CA108B
MMLAKAMKEERAAKAGASSTPAADPVPPPTLSPPPPITAEAPLSSPPSSPNSLAALQTPRCPLPIAAVPLAAASSPAPTPLDKGKRVLEILSDDEDSEGVAPFRRRKSARVPLSALEIRMPLSSLADTNLDKAVMRPINYCTSLTEIGLLMNIIAAHFSGFTCIPGSVSRNPKNFPASTPNTHFSRFSFNLYLAIVVHSSSRSATYCSLC